MALRKKAWHSSGLVHACRRPDFLFVQKVSKDTPEGGKIPNLSPPSGLPPHSNGSRSVLLDNSPCELERLFPTMEPSVSCCLIPAVSPLQRTMCAAAGGLDFSGRETRPLRAGLIPIAYCLLPIRSLCSARCALLWEGLIPLFRFDSFHGELSQALRFLLSTSPVMESWYKRQPQCIRRRTHCGCYFCIAFSHMQETGRFAL